MACSHALVLQKTGGTENVPKIMLQVLVAKTKCCFNENLRTGTRQTFVARMLNRFHKRSPYKNRYHAANMVKNKKN
jgi:hypothetical protein